MRLLLVRHGQTSNNVAGALDTAFPGAGLTELGHAQARAVPKALREERIAGIHVSHLIRTHETASPLAATLGIPLQITEGLEEIAAGDFEMRRDKEAVDAYQDNQSRWAGKALGHALPGGEDGRRFWARYAGALRQIAGYYTDDATVAVFSHGAAIRVFSILATGLAPATRYERPLLNTGMVTLTGHPEQGWQLEDGASEPVGGAHLLGDTSHDVTADATADAAEPAEAADPVVCPSSGRVRRAPGAAEQAGRRADGAAERTGPPSGRGRRADGAVGRTGPPSGRGRRADGAAERAGPSGYTTLRAGNLVVGGAKMHSTGPQRAIWPLRRSRVHFPHTVTTGAPLQSRPIPRRGTTRRTSRLPQASDTSGPPGQECQGHPARNARPPGQAHGAHGP